MVWEERGGIATALKKLQRCTGTESATEGKAYSQQWVIPG